MEKTFYITTAIYYVNDVPHIGHASEAVAADVLARFKRLHGRNVQFTTGTDENAIKVADVARSLGLTTQDYVDSIAPQWEEIFRRLHISNDDFIRTTEPRHRKVVEHVFNTLLQKGDIYKDIYKGWYCISDETFFRETEIVDGRCPNPECRRPVKWVEEENYFFRLSAYGERLLQYIEEHPEAFYPEFRKNEVVSFIKAGLKDACVTRKAYGWGIPVPNDPDQVIYVWFDALLNYLTSAGYLSDDKRFEQTWPADAQLVGKDIFVRFHATLWPAMLMGLNLPLPNKVFGHGFWAIEGDKMSKSKGNVIAPVKLAEWVHDEYGVDTDIAIDAIRYFLLREVTFGLDGDFSVDGLIGRFNSDLANDLGNLLNRTLSLLHANRSGIVPKAVLSDNESERIRGLIAPAAQKVAEHLDELQYSEALAVIWDLISQANKYIGDSAPWKLAKDEKCADLLDTVFYTVLDTVRSIAILVSPFMPTAAEAIWKQLGIEEPLSDQKWADASAWGKLKPGMQTKPPTPIFPRIDTKIKPSTVQKQAKEEQKMERPSEKKTEFLSFDEFKKMDLRIGKVLTAEKVEGADKLLKLIVDIGIEERQIVAGIAQWYAPQDIIGKEIVMVVNLAPAKIRGVESKGMLLAANVDGRAVLLNPDQDVPPGAGIK